MIPSPAMVERRSWLVLCMAWVAARPVVGQVPAETVPPVGRWRGPGRWLDRDVQREAGAFHAELIIHPGFQAEGLFAGVPLARTAPLPRHHPPAYAFMLSQPLSPTLLSSRRHLLLLLSSVQADVLDVDCHLKKRHGLDLGMRVGNLQLRRQA